VLLNQTGVYGGLPHQTKDVSSSTNVGSGKRKRGSEEGMESDIVEMEDKGPMGLLRAQVPALAKALLNQLKSTKTAPATLQAGFGLLHSLLVVLPGSLSGQVTPIMSTSKSILSQAPTTSTSTLHLTCLSFLALFFSTHPPPAFSGALPTLTPVLLKALGERHPRVASESFRVFSALLNAMKPVKNNEWADRVYDEAASRLSKNDTDAEVRACAEDTIADLWICATEVAKSKNRKEWESICRTAGNTEGAVKVVAKVAKEVDIGDQWVNGCVEWLMVLMRKSGRSGKTDVFNALETLLRRLV
jgi:cullin-associated NEDD8-dissociated protein 1